MSECCLEWLQNNQPTQTLTADRDFRYGTSWVMIFDVHDSWRHRTYLVIAHAPSCTSSSCSSFSSSSSYLSWSSWSWWSSLSFLIMVVIVIHHPSSIVNDQPSFINHQVIKSSSHTSFMFIIFVNHPPHHCRGFHKWRYPNSWLIHLMEKHLQNGQFRGTSHDLGPLGNLYFWWYIICI